MSQLFFEQLDDTLVNTLRKVGGGIKEVSKYTDAILGSPLTAIATATNPEYLLPIYAEANINNKGFKSIGAISNGLAEIADRKNYKKKNTVAKNVSNTIERVSKTVKDVSDIGYSFV